jgi:ABC-type branched-subunit amino acid transport system ATPase component
MDKILQVSGIHMSFEGVKALVNLDLEVNQGEIRTIIGPNGSGKTTLINVITGIYTPDAGRILFAGEDVTYLPTHVRARRGITRTFQNLRLFPSFSVLDHILVAQHQKAHVSLFKSILPFEEGFREEQQMRERAMEMLEFVGLADSSFLPAVSLPYGKRRLLEIARALVTQPRLLLLDEPAAGLSSDEISELEELLIEIRSQGVTICLVEHRMQLVLQVAETISVLNYGEKIAEGPPADIITNQEVIEAYLGRDYSPQRESTT